jgi:hypothetical protein
MYTSTIAAATKIAVEIDQPSMSDSTRPSANRFTPPMRTVASANEIELKR